MQELIKLMQYAVGLEFNPAHGPYGVAVVGITFANSQYCSDAYFHLKSLLNGKKINITLKINAITLTLTVEDTTGEHIFTAELNYDPYHLTEFTKLTASDESITMAFAAKRHGRVYLINPETDENLFQPFFVNKYEVIK